MWNIAKACLEGNLRLNILILKRMKDLKQRSILKKLEEKQKQIQSKKKEVDNEEQKLIK